MGLFSRREEPVKDPRQVIDYKLEQIASAVKQLQDLNNAKETEDIDKVSNLLERARKMIISAQSKF